MRRIEPFTDRITAFRESEGNTAAAVMSFQEMMGITADGIIGQQTWELINTVYDELFY